MKTILITGSTQGLGLQIVKKLISKKNVSIIMAVRDVDKGKKIALSLSKNISVVKLDLSSLKNVKEFINNWNTKIDGLINNAGVQFNSKNSFTSDGFEETIAVNHIAAFLLTIGLEKYLKNGRILFIGSGTHNPNHPHAKIFGFRGAQYSSIKQLADGFGNTSDINQLNRDRYSTSKLLNMITAIELSRRNKNIATYVLDPGLMPGTGLARDQNRVMQFLWNFVMPLIGLLLPDTSSPNRSGKAASWIMTTDYLPYKSGTIFSYNKKPNKYVWKELFLNEKIGKEVYEDTLSIVRPYL